MSARSEAVFLQRDRTEERAEQKVQSSVSDKIPVEVEDLDKTVLDTECQHHTIWKRAMVKIKAQWALKKFKEEILLYGTSNNLLDLNNQYKDNAEEILQKKMNKQETFRKWETTDRNIWYIIYPDSMVLNVWSIIITITLIYTAILMPYRMAFSEEVFWDAWTVIDLAIDIIFTIDIFFNLFSGFYRPNATVETSLKKIM